LIITTGITVHGSGPDSTFITGPGGVIGDPTPWTRAAFEINGDVINIERLLVRSSNSLGVGFWIRPGTNNSITHNVITNQNIGIYINGLSQAQNIDGNRIIGDSIGIVTADSVRPLLRNNYISNCNKYGIDIRNLSRPDLGSNDSTYAGHDTIQQCGDNQFHWLIYNGTPNTIWAMGNVWQSPILNGNDLYIYDNEESGGASGPVYIASAKKR
jgi:parallel beta-helix repeat protein